MPTQDLYFTGSVSGNVAGAANALGAPDGTYTTTSGDVSWTHTWSFDPAPGFLTNAQTFTVAIRSLPTNGSGNCDVTVNVRQNGVVRGTQSRNFNGVITVIVNATGFTPDGAVTVEVIGTGSGGGNPNSRTTPAVDACTWTCDYTDIVGSAFKGWDGGAWVDGVLKVWDGAAWAPALVRRWNGNAWELVP
jgi:hypothetical protein